MVQSDRATITEHVYSYESAVPFADMAIQQVRLACCYDDKAINMLAIDSM